VPIPPTPVPPTVGVEFDPKPAPAEALGNCDGPVKPGLAVENPVGAFWFALRLPGDVDNVGPGVPIADAFVGPAGANGVALFCAPGMVCVADVLGTVVGAVVLVAGETVPRTLSPDWST
jgi:hypothetical protein